MNELVPATQSDGPLKQVLSHFCNFTYVSSHKNLGAYGLGVVVYTSSVVAFELNRKMREMLIKVSTICVTHQVTQFHMLTDSLTLPSSTLLLPFFHLPPTLKCAPLQH